MNDLRAKLEEAKDARIKLIATDGVFSMDGIVANLSSNLNVIGPRSTGASKTVYELIVNNGDIIKGAFCGHMHAHYYTEIRANGADGSECFIPQHTLTGVPYNKGHVMKIKIK